jgi:hypothetical protein
VGLAELTAPPRDRDGFGHSVPSSYKSHSRRSRQAAYQRAGYNTKRYCGRFKCLGRDSASDTRRPGCTHYDPSFRDLPELCAMMATTWGRRCSRAAYDHGTNSPGSGQRTAQARPMMPIPKFLERRLDELIEKSCNHYKQMIWSSASAPLASPSGTFSCVGPKQTAVARTRRNRPVTPTASQN